MSDKIIFLRLEGGVVQSIFSPDAEAFKGIKLVTIDYDCDGVTGDQEGLQDVIQDNGTTCRAIVMEHSVVFAEKVEFQPAEPDPTP